MAVVLLVFLEGLPVAVALPHANMKMEVVMGSVVQLARHGLMGRGGCWAGPGFRREACVGFFTHGSIYFHRFHPWHEGVSCLQPVSVWYRFLGYDGVLSPLLISTRSKG